MSVRIEFDPPDVKFVIDTYVKEKKSIYFIADQYGVSTVTVLRLLRANKVKLRARGRQKGKAVGTYKKRAKVAAVAKPAAKAKAKPRKQKPARKA